MESKRGETLFESATIFSAAKLDLDMTPDAENKSTMHVYVSGLITAASGTVCVPDKNGQSHFIRNCKSGIIILWSEQPSMVDIIAPKHLVIENAGGEVVYGLGTGLYSREFYANSDGETLKTESETESDSDAHQPASSGCVRQSTEGTVHINYTF